jgi:hypothetical protein
LIWRIFWSNCSTEHSAIVAQSCPIHDLAGYNESAPVLPGNWQLAIENWPLMNRGSRLSNWNLNDQCPIPDAQSANVPSRVTGDALEAPVAFGCAPDCDVCLAVSIVIASHTPCRFQSSGQSERPQRKVIASQALLSIAADHNRQTQEDWSREKHWVYFLLP